MCMQSEWQTVCALNSADEARNIAAKMINCRIFTKQTGQAGTMCHKVMICERLYSRREYYFAIVMDRAKAVSPVCVDVVLILLLLLLLLFLLLL